MPFAVPRRTLLRLSLLALISPSALAQSAPEASALRPDPFLWLEDIEGELALDWVRQRNAHSQQALQKTPQFEALRGEILDVLDSRDRIPAISRRGDYVYNLWQDQNNRRGLWRRTTIEDYRQASPNWETVIDLDALGATENESWVFAGATVLAPDYRRALVALSRGGSDARVVREFDLVEKRFVVDGFSLPQAKSRVDWIDADTVLVGTDFGPGSLTDSGYPRVIKRWKRGTPLAEAQTVFEGEARDVSVSAWVDKTRGASRILFTRSIDFYNARFWLQQGEGPLRELELPTDVQPALWGDRLLLELRKDWQVGGDAYLAGSLLFIRLADFLSGQRNFQRLFTPSASRSLAGFVVTRDHVLLNLNDQVSSRLEEWDFRARPPRHRTVKAPSPGTVGLSSLFDPSLAQDELGDRYLLNYADFLTPDTLFLARAGSDDRIVLKARKPLFDSSGMRTEQHFARSADGTRVPYFVIWPAGAQADGGNPTLLYGYGGFEISLLPAYSPGRGRAWLGRGGVMVIANIRGGGEFGPRWHQAAIREKKQRSYDDFIAVAEDLIRRKITSAAHLGIMGGSNGGLLVGATMVQRPDLFKAVVCQVPLLDMRRYHGLLAGASWMAEYGNPDEPEDWQFIERYSPYHGLQAGRRYPKVLFTTSTKDDRVHPGHARKMAAKMLSEGHEVLYFENIEGGHGGAADNQQLAMMQALEYSHLWRELGR